MIEKISEINPIDEKNGIVDMDYITPFSELCTYGK